MAGCVALVVGAGQGARFGGEIPKQYMDLGGIPVLRRTLTAFLTHPAVDAVRAVIHPDHRFLFETAAHGLDVPAPVDGGATRQDSVRLGLASIADLEPDIVLIHDAARPGVSHRVIADVIAALRDVPGAIPALAVRDTLKRGADGRIETTVERAGLWRAQTPQGFRYAEIVDAHARCIGLPVTDDAAVAEQAGLAVAIVPGEEINEKVTTPQDLERLEALMTGFDIRTGIGYDVHRFEAGNGVMLCGVEIPFVFKLKGHSDADVALHAVTDAIFGALGDGDIGSHFPPSDPQWKGAASHLFLEYARHRVAERGGTIANVDVTIICEAPKIGPHRERMRRRLSEILGIGLERVGVKGTTTERLGFAGRGEGIAAQAVATIRL